MNSKDYRRQWAEGEIEAGTLLDAIDELQYCVTELSQQLSEAISVRAAIAEELAALKDQPKEHLPLFTCMGKGGEYAKIGYAKPAGALKAIQGDSGVIVYRDIDSDQLYFRDPRDFQSRMLELCDLEPCSLGGDILRELTTADRDQGKQ